MKIPKIIIFSINRERGADKNLFMITNFLSNKFKDVCIITSKDYLNNLNKKIKYIGPNTQYLKTLAEIENFYLSILSFKTVIFNRNC